MTTKSGDLTKAAIIADVNIDKVQWNRNLNFHAKKAIKTAEEYSPAVPANWAVVPTTQDAALDALGAAVKGITPAAVDKYAGKHTVTAGEDTADQVVLTIVGVLSTDIVLAQLQSGNAASVIKTAVATADTVTISGTLSANDVVGYIVVRLLP